MMFSMEASETHVHVCSVLLATMMPRIENYVCNIPQ